MKKYKNIAIMCLSIFLFACTNTAYEPKINYDVNPNLSSVDYKTYSWLNIKISSRDQAYNNPVKLQKIKDLINEELKIIGYKEVNQNNNPDFQVSFTVGSKEKLKTTVYSGYNYSRWGGSYYGAQNSVRIQNYSEGVISIDIFDSKMKEPFWHGWATQKINNKLDENQKDENLNHIINSILKNFQ